jgi:RpiB/LacA/LacB family sugar-phosphate isomerase
MRVAIGSDHSGFEMKEALRFYLGALQHDVLDLGTHSTAPVDYPDYAEAVGIALRRGKAERGIMVYGSGQTKLC